MKLLANGYTPLPCHRDDKHPILIGWPDVAVTQAHVDSWDVQFPKANSTGIRSEGFDLDISNDEVCADLENEIVEWFDSKGEILPRFGRAPRRFIPIRVTDKLTKQLRAFKDKAGNPHGIELLGSRSQFIAYGTHPAGYAYRWAKSRGPLEVPASDLPQVSADEALQLLEHLCEVLVQRYGYSETTREKSGSNGHCADWNGASDAPFDAAAALDAMQPTGASVEDTQRRVILSWLQQWQAPGRY
jgi:hypothetical protein